MPRTETLMTGAVILGTVIKQGNSGRVQFYLPQAAVRYMNLAAGDQLSVQALPNGVIVLAVSGSVVSAVAPAQVHVATPVRPARTELAREFRRRRG